MTFLAASRLWLMVAVAVVGALYVFMQARRKRYVVRFTNLDLLDSVAPKRPGWRRHVPAVAFLLSLIALTTAFAQPAHNAKVPRERATVVMAIDVSLSMEATDIEPNRIEAARVAAQSFVDLLPPRLNLGLVTFSGLAQVVVSPTTDHDLVRRSLDNLILGRSTAVGEAVFASLTNLKALPSEPGRPPAPARIVLMSDGETTVGRPNGEAAAEAFKAKVPVSTIAFGTDKGTVQVEGTEVPVPVNRQALRELAEATGGSYFEAASAKELKKVYADIGTSVGYRTVKREITSWFVGLALVFALAAAAASLAWFSRLP